MLFTDIMSLHHTVVEVHVDIHNDWAQEPRSNDDFSTNEIDAKLCTHAKYSFQHFKIKKFVIF